MVGHAVERRDKPFVEWIGVDRATCSPRLARRAAQHTSRGAFCVVPEWYALQCLLWIRLPSVTLSAVLDKHGNS